MNLYGLTRKELEDYFLSIGEKKFKSTQVYEWLYDKRVTSISEFSNIKKAIVCVKTDSLNRQFLCAYFISDQRISISELKNYLNSFLPNYMIPNFLIQISDFPYTPNGKIDRKSLPDFNIQNDINNAILPKTKTQKQISAIFEKLLCIFW